METSLEALSQSAKGGDKTALEALIRQIQNQIYSLSLKMLYHPEDAEDATQEILIKIITHIGSFKGKSAFLTWAYRIAANHLLTTKKRRVEHKAESFEEYEEKLDRECGEVWQEIESDAQQNVILEEIRISCLQGLLLSLDRRHRLTFILVHILNISNELGAEILNITQPAFRKRLSRARAKLCDFMAKNCKLIDPRNRCQCERLAARDVQNGKIDVNQMIFADHPCRVKHQEVTFDNLKELDELKRIGVVFKTYTDFLPPSSILENIKNLITSREYNIF